MSTTLVFDLDGTIIDSARGILASVRYTLETMGVEPPPDDRLRWVIGPPLRPTFATLLGGPDHVETCVRTYREHYGREGLAACDPYPGIAEELTRLRGAGHTLLVCTSKMESFAQAIIERIGFGGLFQGIYGAQMGAADDDKAELLGRVLSRHGVDPARAIMIGDRREDIVAGQSNGLTTIGVLWGYGAAAELAAAGATALCPAVADLGPTLARYG